MRPSFTLVGVLLLLLQQGLCSSQESRFATVRRLTAARDVLHRISEPQDLDLGPEITRPLFSWDLSSTNVMPQGQLQSPDSTPANVTDTEDVEKKNKKSRGKKKKKKKKKKKHQNNNQIAVNSERDDYSAIIPKTEDKTAKAKKTKLDRKKKEKRRRRKEKQEKKKKQEEQRANNLVPVQTEDMQSSKKIRNKTNHKPVVNSSELVPASPSSGENDVHRFRKMSTILDSIVESNSVPLLDPLAVNNPLNTSPYDSKNEAINSDKETEIIGDLSCLQGRFLPAPPVEHAVIKYVRGSFLEAEYECELDYKLEPEGLSKLVCKEYEWLGQRPMCVSVSGVNRTTSICKGCEHLCTLQDGQPKCACYRGFILKGSSCQDIDECATMNGGCEELCHNTLGSYHCQCAQGFRLADNGKNCVDINECLLRNGHGPCQDSCENLPGSYRCSCKSLAGTRLAADNHTCEDLDECSRNNAGCSHICLNTLGRAFCLCPPGFMLGSDWKTCNDVDECEDPDLQEAETCSIGCINTIGSYHCIDLQDEAIPPQPQSETRMTMTTTTLPLTTVSSTTMISFTSTASELESTMTEASTSLTTTELSSTELYEMDITTTATSAIEVTDDVETSTTVEQSTTEATTLATTDAWENDSETTFYTTTEQSTTDVITTTEPSTTSDAWLTSLPTTETVTMEATTAPTAESATIQSTTEATTQELTTMEMLTKISTTTEMLTTVPTTTETTTEFTTSTTAAPVLCPPGFRRGENNKCEDVNECAVQNGGCSHTCYNSLGRAFCLCPPGFMLSSDWKTCKAMEIHSTRPPKVFVACPPGYRANSKGHCKDVDECIKQNGGCSHGCINIRGSYRCVCGRGFFLGADRRTCIKEDLDVVCPPLNTPPNGYLQCIRRVIMTGPERWRARWRRRVINHAGTVCDLRCPHGYKLQGDFHKVCDGSGKWSGPEEGTCIPVAPRAEVPRKLSVRSLKGWQSWYATDLFNYILVRYALPKPRIQCPDNIVAELEPGHEKAFVAFPQPDTNVNWFRDVISRPRWGKMLEADLRPGQWKVTFTAIDPMTHHSSSCILLITVVGPPG